LEIELLIWKVPTLLKKIILGGYHPPTRGGKKEEKVRDPFWNLFGNSRIFIDFKNFEVVEETMEAGTKSFFHFYPPPPPGSKIKKKFEAEAKHFPPRLHFFSLLN
jgi:hypothetical protein